MTDDSSHKIPHYVMSDFESLEPIAQGAGGLISLGKLEDFGHVAVKQFIWSRNTPLEMYKKEIDILIGHRHPNIVHIYGILWDGIHKSRYLGYVMEYIAGGSLHDVIHGSKWYTIQEMCNWIVQISRGIQFLHKCGIIHRDIKPTNVLVAGEQLKLADFGIAKDAESSTTAGAGTYRYMAPEMGRGKSSLFSDVYSLGITIWEIFHRKMPFHELEDVSMHVISTRIMEGGRPVIESQKMDEDIAVFVQRCWHTDREERPPIREIIDYFEKKEKFPSRSVKWPGCPLPIEGEPELEEQEKSTILITGGYEGRRPPHTVIDSISIMTDNYPDWLEITKLKYPKCNGNHNALCLNDELYIVGHHDQNSFFKLNKYLAWVNLAPMLRSRLGSFTNSCLVWNECIWVLGGVAAPIGDTTYAHFKAVNAVERYDPKEDKWTLMPDMIYPRSDAAAVVWNNRIVISGGITDENVWIGKKGTCEFSNFTDTVECFNPEDNLWTELPSMPFPRYGHVLVCYKNKLITIGGSVNKRGERREDEVWELDPHEIDPKWKQLPDIMYRSDLAAVVFNEEIHVMGGLAGKRKAPTNTTEIFDGEEWRPGPDLAYNRYNFSALVIPQHLADSLRLYEESE